MQHTPVADGTSCADDDVCNGDEVCAAGACQPGTALNVDDGNNCTSDGCDPITGVQHTPVADGTSCADDDVCNGDEVCGAGVCQPGTPVNTDDGNNCTSDSCDPVNGVQHTAVADGTSCADNDVCNGNEVCAAGACQPGTAPNVDDGNNCTSDGCDPITGVQHTPVADGTSCADDDVCNGDEVCAAGACQPGTPIDTDDGNTCTSDSCDPVNGVQTRACGSRHSMPRWRPVQR